MDKPLFKYFIGLIVLFTALAAIYLVSSQKAQTPIIPAFASQVAPPTPAPASETDILAPDGKMTLTVREEKTSDGLKKTFLATRDGESSTQIYSKTEPVGSNLSVPYNTFSPDDRYIFLKESTPSGTYYYALLTDGKPMTKDSQAVEITGLFYPKYPDFKITDMTGWGGMTLIVINVNNADGTPGPSFWFDVVSQSFIRLGTRFN